MSSPSLAPQGVKIDAPIPPGCEDILTPEAIAFIADLHRRFDARRRDLLNRRIQRQTSIDAGQLPDFLPETAEIRKSNYVVAPIPQDLLDRRVEITGPVDRKMVINALNSGANVFMADFEDSNSPTWENNLNGQINMRDAVRGRHWIHQPGRQTVQAESAPCGAVRSPARLAPARKACSGRRPADLRRRCSISACTSFTTRKPGWPKGRLPTSICPRCRVISKPGCGTTFSFTPNRRLGVPNGTIRATVLIETLLAAFEMDEILWELRDHSAGLNCGRWDYIFSFIKTFKNHPKFMMPDRVSVTMDKHFLKSYVDLLIQTCHRREIHAMGGMAAQIPIKNDAAANDAAHGKGPPG